MIKSIEKKNKIKKKTKTYSKLKETIYSHAN